MKKTSKKDFRTFKKEFLKYINLFGLKDYKLYFKHIKLKNNYATIEADERGKWAVINMTSEKHKDFCEPKCHAKHEAIHLLLHKLTNLAESRYCSFENLEIEEEALVRILEKMIP